MNGSSRGSGVEPTVTTAVAGAGGADEAARVLQRLERIEALDRERAPATRLLGELRALIHEAEAWAQVDAATRSRDAVGMLGPADDGAEAVAATAASGAPRGGAAGAADKARSGVEAAGPAPERESREEVEGMR